MKKTEKITGLLVDVKNNVARKATIEKSLDGYYKALDCTCIDIVSRHIGGQGFDIICDDEALLKDSPRPSAISERGEPMLFNSLFVVNYDGAGDVCSLREGQMNHLKRYLRILVDDTGHWPALIDCDY